MFKPDSLKKITTILAKLYFATFRSPFLDNPLIVGLSFGCLACAVETVLFPVIMDAVKADQFVVSSFIEWFGVAYGLLLALVLVNVWSQFDTLDREFDKEADAVAILQQTASLILSSPSLTSSQDNSDYTVSNTPKNMINMLIDDYVNHVLQFYRIEHKNKRIRKYGDKIIEDIRFEIGRTIHSAERDAVLSGLLLLINEVADVRGDRISHSKQRIPSTVWNLAFSASVIWLLPFYGLNITHPAVFFLLIGGVTFIVTSLLAIIHDLDEPFGGTWNVNMESWDELKRKMKLRQRGFGNVLITGSFNEFGSVIVNELIESGYDVRCLEEKTRSTKKILKRFKDKVEVVWGDISDFEIVRKSVADQEVIIHLADIVPPTSEKNFKRAYSINVVGTRNIISACALLPNPPRILLGSTTNLFGYTQTKEPYQRVESPIQAHNTYTQTKGEAETMMRNSGLSHIIFRFADTQKKLNQQIQKTPLSFLDINLDNRMELIHPLDIALAISKGLEKPTIWDGRVLLIGGGKKCQIKYENYIRKLLHVFQIGDLPQAAFGTKEYDSDWLDTSESEALLQFQRYSFEEIIQEEVSRRLWLKLFIPFRPIIVWLILKKSPYYFNGRTISSL